MKKFLAILIFGVCLMAGKAENKTVKFTVEPPLVCNNCETKVKENLRFEKGIKNVNPSAKKGEIEVTYDDSKTSPDQIKEGFRKIGYDATLVCPEELCSPSAPCSNETSAAPCCNRVPSAPCCNEVPVASCCNEVPTASGSESETPCD